MRLLHFGGVEATARWQGHAEQLEKPSSSRREIAVDDDPDLVARLTPGAYPARSEQAIVFEVEAWDVNCPRHIAQKLDAAEVAEVFARLQRKIGDLERENESLRVRLRESVDPVDAVS